jgi:hypothetical protein
MCVRTIGSAKSIFFGEIRISNPGSAFNLPALVVAVLGPYKKERF